MVTWCVVLALGIMAPQTAQGASAEKDGGADAVAVVDGKAFDLKNRCFHRAPSA